MDLSSLVVPDKQHVFPKSTANKSEVTGGWGLSGAGPQTCWHLKVFCPCLVSFVTCKMKLLMLYLPLEANAWKNASSLEAVFPMVGESPKKLQNDGFDITQMVPSYCFVFKVVRVHESVGAQKDLFSLSLT